MKNKTSKTRVKLPNMEVFKDYPDVVDINEMCQMLGGISTKTGYKILSEKKIRSFKIGRKHMIPKIFILEFLFGKTIDLSEVIGDEK